MADQRCPGLTGAAGALHGLARMFPHGVNPRCRLPPGACGQLADDRAAVVLWSWRVACQASGDGVLCSLSPACWLCILHPVKPAAPAVRCCRSEGPDPESFQAPGHLLSSDLWCIVSGGLHRKYKWAPPRRATLNCQRNAGENERGGRASLNKAWRPQQPTDCVPAKLTARARDS